MHLPAPRETSSVSKGAITRFITVVFTPEDSPRGIRWISTVAPVVVDVLQIANPVTMVVVLPGTVYAVASEAVRVTCPSCFNVFAITASYP